MTTRTKKLGPVKSVIRKPITVTPKSDPVSKEIAARVLARRSLLYFTRKTHPSYDPGWVHDDICKRLERFSQQVADKKSPRLMLLMPPRHGKSELASIRFPAWHLGHFPHHEIINVGYNLDLPMKFSRRVREILRDKLYQGLFPKSMIDPESQAAEAWSTTMGGGFTAAGVGGGITGKGAHILLIDDPLKNNEEADSATHRDSLWEWYMSTAYTRLAPGGGVLLIETWWNDDDLAGRLQQLAKADPLADQFELIKYPAIAEAYEYRDKTTLNIRRETTPIHDEAADTAYTATRASGIQVPFDVAVEGGTLELLRRPGEALHRSRYDEDALRRIKATQLPRIWSALFQQNPVPDEGAFFKKEYFRFEHQVPEATGNYIYTAWDFAIGEKQQNDFTVGSTIMQDASDTLHVMEVFRMKGDSFQIVEAILDVAQRHGSYYNTSYLMGFEDGMIWRAIKPLLMKRMAERKMFPSYETLKPLSDKMARARPLQGRMQQGRVVFPESASWRAETEMELLRFPAGVHDDIVDSLAWAVHLCMGKSAPRKWVAPEPKSWKDQLDARFNHSTGHMAA